MKKIKLLQAATAYQSLTSILEVKLKYLDQNKYIDLHTLSSYKEKEDSKNATGKYKSIYISRKISLIKDIISIIQIYKYIKKQKFDIIHTHTAKAGMVCAVAAFLVKTPVVHSYHGLPFYEGQNKIKYFIIRFSESFLSLIRTSVFSQNMHDYNILKKSKLIKCPVLYEGNGVDVEYINKNAKDNLDKIDDLFNDKNKKHLLCISRLEKVKHLEKFIDAIKYLKDKDFNIDAIIAGQGNLKYYLENYIKQKKIDSIIKIVFIKEIHSLLYKSDIVVLTSKKEGMPRCVMEAMALKKPVVATDVLGTNEVVKNNETGFLVSFDDQNMLNKRILELLLNNKLAHDFGYYGYNRAKQNFDDKMIAQKWVELYFSILTNFNS